MDNSTYVGELPLPGKTRIALVRAGYMTLGDLLLCPACLLNLGEDNRPMCPSCNMLVPMGFIGLMPCDENIFIAGCPCGYLWDERVEGHTAWVWKAMGVQP